MTVKDVLVADHNVDNILVSVRDKNFRFIAEYVIGKNVCPSKHHCYQYDTEAGGVYLLAGVKHFFIDKEIQFHEADALCKGTRGYGVMLDKIPKELLNLKVTFMSPQKGITKDLYHGYEFICCSDLWFGIPGEGEKIEREQNV